MTKKGILSMTKKQLITALATSTLVLSTAGTAFADEVTPIDPTTPSTEVVTPDPSSGSSTDTSDTRTSTEPTGPVDPTGPSSDVTEVTDDNGVTTDHTMIVVPKQKIIQNLVKRFLRWMMLVLW